MGSELGAEYFRFQRVAGHEVRGRNEVEGDQSPMVVLQESGTEVQAFKELYSYSEVSQLFLMHSHLIRHPCFRLYFTNLNPLPRSHQHVLQPVHLASSHLALSNDHGQIDAHHL